MDRRLLLDQELRNLMDEVMGYTNIYFEPTALVKMKYDCIRYKFDTYSVRKANDRSYLVRDKYEVVVISRNPECELPKKIQEHFKLCIPGRFYIADNLHHFPFTITY